MRLTSALIMAILTASSAVLASMSTFKYATDDVGKRHYLSCKDKLPKASIEGGPWKWKTDCRQIEFNDVPVGALVEEYGRLEDAHETSFVKPNPKCPLSPLPLCGGDSSVELQDDVIPPAARGLWREGPYEPYGEIGHCFYHGVVDGKRMKNCTGVDAWQKSVWTRIMPILDSDAQYFQDGFLMEELSQPRVSNDVPPSTVTDVPRPHDPPAPTSAQDASSDDDSDDWKGLPPFMPTMTHTAPAVAYPEPWYTAK